MANIDPIRRAEIGREKRARTRARDKRRHRAALPKNGRYLWTVFKPETPAVQELRELVEQRRVGLPIAVRESLAEAAQALDHMKKGRRGRAPIPPG